MSAKDMDWRSQINWNLGENLKTPIKEMIDHWKAANEHLIETTVQNLLKQAMDVPLVPATYIIHNTLTKGGPEVPVIWIYVLSNGKDKSVVRVFTKWQEEGIAHVLFQTLQEMYDRFGYILRKDMPAIGQVIEVDPEPPAEG